SEGRRPLSLWMSRLTSASPNAARSAVPEKMTSSIFVERSARARCSPSTQRMASMMLDLPHPLGPTTEVIPSRGKMTSTRLAKDLNPLMRSLERYIDFLETPENPGPSGAPAGWGKVTLGRPEIGVRRCLGGYRGISRG